MDKLIINNRQVETVSADDECLEFSFGKPTVKHSITLKVVKDSEADLALRKFIENEGKYKFCIDIKEK